MQVYYDPDAPSRSVLEPGVSARSYFFLAAGLGFMALAVILGPVIHFFRMRRPGS